MLSDPAAVRRHRRAALAAAALVLVAALTLALVPTSAPAAKRPPLPAGGVPIAPGHIPIACADGAPETGYYWSAFTDAWASAPNCVQRGDGLDTLQSQVGAPGQAVTMTAVPNEGSNSATYAPQAKSITWTYPGRRVSGCGTADLSCTAVPFTRASKLWQWGQFHVTMPRTYVIDAPGDLCGGRRLCAGATTSAWGWAGTPPGCGGGARASCGPDTLHVVGKVYDFSGQPVTGATVLLTGVLGTTKHHDSFRTGADGEFSFTYRFLGRARRGDQELNVQVEGYGITYCAGGSSSCATRRKIRATNTDTSTDQYVAVAFRRKDDPTASAPPATQ